MKNITLKKQGNILTITIDLSKSFGPSKSGKTDVIASTEGFAVVPDSLAKIGINVIAPLK